MRLLRAHTLSPVPPAGLKEEANGLLVLDGEGRILEHGPAQALLPRFPGHPVEDLRPLWILPGLVDLHVHLPQYGAVAMDGLGLLPWLETCIFPAEARFADPGVAAASAEGFFRALLRRGTTTAAVYATVHETATDAAFRAAEACGIRAVIGKVMMDRHAPRALAEDTAESLRASERLCEAWNGRDGGRLRYAFTPRFAPSCSRELMRAAGERAKAQGAFLQSHLSESLEELARVKALFPEAASYTELYARLGLLGPRSLMAHGVHLAPAERARLRDSGTALVHCPRSNAFLKSGTMPLRRWMTEGLRVGLGTDVGAGPTLSLWAEAAFACTASKLRVAERRSLAARLRAEGPRGVEAAAAVEALDPSDEAPVSPLEAWHLATLGGARALGLEDRIGSLEPGREADLVVVDPGAVDPREAGGGEAPERVLSRLLYRERPDMVVAAYVRGRRCSPAT